MKQFTSVDDIDNLTELLKLAAKIKQNPYNYKYLGKDKILCLLFFNPSLRTRLSTQKAALNLGMNTLVLNLNNESWAIEIENGSIMNKGTQEHIKEAARVISSYCDVIGIRTFAGMTNKIEDYQELILNKFISYATVPIISLESATLHPLQSLADLMTIEEQKKKSKIKVVLTWVPHSQSLPQAVANSFAEWVSKSDVEFVIANPPGFNLSKKYTKNALVTHNQNEALKEADFVYSKNWSSYENYGEIGNDFNNWMITKEKLKLTANAKFMHCLPIRRNVVASDAVIDSKDSLVIEQANNRTFAAQSVLFKLLQNEK